MPLVSKKPTAFFMPIFLSPLTLHYLCKKIVSMDYRDEIDKCYGIAGMAIGGAVWGGEDLICKLDLDDEDGGYVTFAPAFYFSHPTVSAKATWQYKLKNYRLMVAMLISNMLCRSMHGRSFSYSQIVKKLYSNVEAEGRSECQLESDEIRLLFDRAYRKLDDVFDSRQVHGIADEFVSKLKEKRSLSNSEIRELLGIIEN